MQPPGDEPYAPGTHDAGPGLLGTSDRLSGAPHVAKMPAFTGEARA